MAYKMKGSSFYGKNGKSPVKQLKSEYMRTPQEKEFYSTAESKDYEPVPAGEIRGIGSYSRYTGPNTTKEGPFGPVSDKKTGDIVSKGVAGSKPKKKVATSEKVGPAESAEMIAKKKKLARDEAKGPSGTIFDASDADMDRDEKERNDYRESKKYVKTK